MNIQSKAINDVVAERQRQIQKKGYTPDHDDLYEQNELVRAASEYTNQVIGRGWFFERHPALYQSEVASDFWPWDKSYWKPKSPREDLVRATAMLIAEIERLDRKSEKTDSEVQQHE
ncbi:hypothetical protein EAH57_14980 [Acinetobacter sp. 2JN-4]|uniref:hypothetical protein n=1 Tax=Acinetobacter sp. 2JN-4 TaxID=2479844 RepID=UPI000EF97E8B|nr:hypothetical protein [Acinetobacter sp. 2JN-4]RLZ06831.1 hypothetical protein EAH57_14980 [Acinetobacter sp. 2JN-4]